MQAVSESPRPPGYSGRVSKLRAHAANYTRKLPAHLAHVVRVYGPPACKLLGKATVRLLALLGKGLALGAFVVGKFTLTALWKLHREQERRRTGFQAQTQVTPVAPAQHVARSPTPPPPVQQPRTVISSVPRTPATPKPRAPTQPSVRWVDITDDTVHLPDGAPHGLTWRAAMQSAMDASRRGKKFQVERVERIFNTFLWRSYDAERDHVQHSLADLPISRRADRVQPPLVNTFPQALHGRGRGFNAGINECYLWHGTAFEISYEIAREGFNERLCSTSGYFGAGNYFAEDPAKSDAYTKPRNNGAERTLILARVCLGHPLRLPPGEKRPQIRELDHVPGAARKRRFDSLIGNPTLSDNEYVVYKGARVLPDFIVTYTRL